MFETMTVGEILRDIRSIKVPKKTRAFIDEARDYFQANGVLSTDVQRKLRNVCERYAQQMKELHAARARARRTNGLRAMGISREEAARRVADRRAAEAERKRDVGF